MCHKEYVRHMLHYKINAIRKQAHVAMENQKKLKHTTILLKSLPLYYFYCEKF